ncbi:hypothetical protein J8273_6655 [Carpediemonas membranifera]|uniref:Uncharacterized protein n=1 Tax=Carpediemonas membranifera TaxID=201153 RepID=A0A8J6DYE0_9EUKA|nr:hypothetical protein J8273_6655 [Carpediemonas membranifera]|eukprot:KAG9392064.1 hypothetical protein J8273_6655 [Carpediemonas membranifera]
MPSDPCHPPHRRIPAEETGSSRQTVLMRSFPSHAQRDLPTRECEEIMTGLDGTKAAGLSGWSNKHILQLLGRHLATDTTRRNARRLRPADSNKSVVSAMTEIVSRIVRGESSCRPLTQAYLSMLPKPNGSLRPIGVNEPFYVIAGKYLAKLALGHLKPDDSGDDPAGALPDWLPEQYGLGGRSDVEKLISPTRTYTTQATHSYMPVQVTAEKVIDELSRLCGIIEQSTGHAKNQVSWMCLHIIRKCISADLNFMFRTNAPNVAIAESELPSRLGEREVRCTVAEAE